jgi:hypothetical protein
MLTDESRNTAQFIGAALDILEQDGPMTFRQLFYRLVCAGQIDNNVQDYERAREIMAKLRGDGRCPSGWILGRRTS